MNESPFKAIQDAQETQREGWMPEIKEAVTAPFEGSTERDLAAKDAEIDRLKKELGDSQEVAQDAIRCISNVVLFPLSSEDAGFKAAINQDFTALTLRLKALTSQRQ